MVKLIAVLSGVVMLIFVINSLRQPYAPVASSAPRVPAVSVSAATVPKLTDGYDPSKKDERAAFCKELGRLGAFGDISVAHHIGRLRVGPKFSGLPFKDKQSFAGVAFAWCMDNDIGCKLLVLHDPLTDKEIGEYSPLAGGLKMN